MMSEVSATEWARAFDGGDVRKAEAINQALVGGAVLKRDRAHLPREKTPVAAPEISTREWAEIVRGGDWHGAIAMNFRTGSREPVTTAQLEQIVLTIARAHHQALDAIDELRCELAVVRREHEQFAKAVADEVMRYQGVWRQDKTYERGTAVSYGGGLWLCVDTSDARPGSNDCWRLTVKSGRAP